MQGRAVGRFRLLEELGRGGMGIVYRAEDLELRREVALKALPLDLAGDARRLNRFRQEARSLAALNHPCIVTIYDIEELEGRLFLAMELVRGKELNEVIPPGGLDLATFLRLAIPLSDAVSAAHEKGVVHRDLKPRNIMVTREGRVKVLDFGLATIRQEPEETPESQLATESLTESGSVMGTPDYMAPEQLRGEPADQRSDIFSLGVLLYRMATGRHPFPRGSGSVAERLSAILRDDPPRLEELRPDLPSHLDRILRGCLAKDPEHRFQSAKGLRNQLEILEEDSVQAQRVPADAGNRPFTRGRLALAGGGLLAAVVIVIGILTSRLDSPFVPARPPAYVAVQAYHSFPGEVTDEVYRSGFLAALGEQLRALEGVWLVPPTGDPLPDLVIQADVRRRGDGLALAFGIRDPTTGEAVGGDLLEGAAASPFELLDRAGLAVAGLLSRVVDRPVHYRNHPPPTRDPDAFELYLRAMSAPEANAGSEADIHVETLRKALAVDPSFVQARVLLGERLRTRYLESREEHWLKQAEGTCRAAAAAAPDLAAAHLCLAEIHQDLERPRSAIDSYLRAIELDVTARRASDGLYIALARIGLPEVAERNWQRVVDLHPDHWAGYAYLGLHLSASNRHQEAIEHFRLALALGPRNPIVHLWEGMANQSLGRYLEAISVYTRSQSLRDSPAASSNIGVVYMTLRRIPDAIQAFERAAELPLTGSEPCRVQGNLARAYHWAPGRQEEAVLAFRRAVDLCRDRAEARPQLPHLWLWLAYSLAVLGEPEASRAALDKALVLGPLDAHALEFAAWVHLRLGDRERALDRLEQAVLQGLPLSDLRANFELDDLRDDARFQSLLGET